MLRLGWWLMFTVCLIYGGFAIYMAGLETTAILGLTIHAPERVAPIVFVIHAGSGGVALLSSPLQFNKWLRQRWLGMHRRVGRLYLGATLVGGLTSLLLAISFDVNSAAKLSLGSVGLVWLGTTAIAFLRIRRRDVARHREWMIRSVSMALFFVTFSLWVPAFAATSVPPSIGYPIAVSLSWMLNLFVAELSIRASRRAVLRTPS